MIMLMQASGVLVSISEFEHSALKIKLQHRTMRPELLCMGTCPVNFTVSKCQLLQHLRLAVASVALELPCTTYLGFKKAQRKSYECSEVPLVIDFGTAISQQWAMKSQFNGIMTQQGTAGVAFPAHSHAQLRIPVREQLVSERLR